MTGDIQMKQESTVTISRQIERLIECEVQKRLAMRVGKIAPLTKAVKELRYENDRLMRENRNLRQDVVNLRSGKKP